LVKETERRIALFLDFENLVTNTGITAATFDLQPSIDRLLEKGKVIFRRAYCDWTRFKEAKANLHEVGVELIDVPPSTRTGKNGADMRLVIDALELCYARDYIDTFVIGSGDSDFCPLAYKLRENNRVVIGLGVKEATSRLFVKACDEFLYLKGRSDKQKEKPTEGRRTRRSQSKTAAAVPEQPAANEVQAPPAAAPTSGGSKRKPKAVPELAREVVSRLLARATGPINPSLIKETIVRKEPDFDEREHGFSTFSKMLEALEREGLLRRQQVKGRQWYVVPADVTPPVEVKGEPEDENGDDGRKEPIQEEIPF